jgi:DNA recombination protein RmuC
MAYFVIGLIVGLALGVALAWWLLVIRRKSTQDARIAIEQQMREAFASLAAAALDANSKQLTERAATTLDGKKELIDQAVKNINERLTEQSKYFRQIEGDRKTEFGKLSTSVTSLARTTGELHQVLASTQRRGAWGERMADDILRLAGLQEGVNYRKQSSADAESGRPDFTFMLPNDMAANMDVKFPLENYKAYLDADSDEARAASAGQLVKDVRGHVREVASRGYIDSAGGTVPYVILFLASEQLYSLVLETEADLIDEALGKKIVLAGPMTLYAMLAVIRQAAENANLMKTADEVLGLMGAFYKQWRKYNEAVDALGKRLEQATDQFQTVSTTRSNMLQRPLDKIEDLRQQRGLPEEAD